MNHVMKFHEWVVSVLAETDRASWPDLKQIQDMLKDAVEKDLQEKGIPDSEKPKYFRQSLMEILGVEESEMAKA